MSIALLVAIGTPALAAVLGGIFGWRPITAWFNVVAAATIGGCGVALWPSVRTGARPAVGTLLGADGLVVTMLLIIGIVAILATLASVGYVGTELAHGHTDARGARRYAALTPAFLAAMVLAVTTTNLGLMWVAIEATTVVTAFLVGHRGTRTALEATWKYLIICSVGIAMAFLGTILLYFCTQHAGLRDGLDMRTLLAHAGSLDPAVMRIAAGLLVLGYGAKAGLVPFHTWLADAHSQAPAPVSALMSGVLLAVAMSIIVRLRPILDPAAGSGFVRGELLTIGLATLAVAAGLMTTTGDLKRLLAYSSMENMGLIALAAAAGTTAAITALALHALAHGVGKTILFLGSGTLQNAHDSTAIADISAVLARSRLLGISLGAGTVMLAGLPPFALFASEIAIARALTHAHLAWALGVALILVVIAFAALLRTAGRVLLGPATAGAPPIKPPRAVTAALVTAVAASVVLGVTAGPLTGIFGSAATQVTVAK